MTFAHPEYPKPDVRRAGEWLADETATPEQEALARAILSNWRAAHGYPLNTFQATLRTRLKRIDAAAIVGQRLKRAPSVIAKLKRFNTMQLNQMQDIAGLRAIVSSMAKLRKIHENYKTSPFSHELVKTQNYVETPKPDGYRSIHLIYRYKNELAPVYSGLHVELQLRTKLQHAWATAVETVDAFLGEAIKAGRPGERWALFFKLASAVFSDVEGSPRLAEYKDVPRARLVEMLRQAERDLGVLLRLRGFTVAANQIQKSGRSSASYHLIVLNIKARKLNIKSFALADQEAAMKAYSEAEARASSGEEIDPVLVRGGDVEQLRKTFPNYFLDTGVFVNRVELLLRDGV